MSIGPIEDYPTSDDEVTIVDPGDVTVEPSHGHDTEAWELSTGHADPDAENITHMPGVSRGREVDGMDFFDLDIRRPDHGKGTDPEAAFRSGTETRPDRYVHDEALQVRQVLATQVVTQALLIPAGVPTLLAVQRLERIKLHIRLTTNSGAPGETLFISPNRGAVSGILSPTGGASFFAMSVPGASGIDAEVAIESSAELWASSSDDMTVYLLDEFRTDVDAQ